MATREIKVCSESDGSEDAQGGQTSQSSSSIISSSDPVSSLTHATDTDTPNAAFVSTTADREVGVRVEDGESENQKLREVLLYQFELFGMACDA